MEGRKGENTEGYKGWMDEKAGRSMKRKEEGRRGGKDNRWKDEGKKTKMKAAAANRPARGQRVGLQSHVPGARHHLTCLPRHTHARTQAEMTTGKCRRNNQTHFQATLPPFHLSIHLSFISLAFLCDEVPILPCSLITDRRCNRALSQWRRTRCVGPARAAPLLCQGEFAREQDYQGEGGR